MTDRIESYVYHIVNQIDGSKEEKMDLYDELVDHLQLSRDALMQSGLTEEEAEKKAFERFGNIETVSSQMQEAMYPYRKLLLGLLAIISILYAYAVYIVDLFVLGNAHGLWLVLAVTVSSLLLMVSMQVYPHFDRKFIVNSLLIVHALIFLASAAHSTPLAIVAWFLVLATIVLIYRTTIIDYSFKVTSYPRTIKGVHFYNITFGVIIFFGTLFVLWSFLLFADRIPFFAFLFLVPMMLWIVIYTIQMRLLYKGNLKLAILCGSIPLLMVGLIGVYLLSNVF